MSKVLLLLLRERVQQRLAAAAEQIFELIEKTIAEYEEEFILSRHEKTCVETLSGRHADVQQGAETNEEAWRTSVEPEPPNIKEEQEEQWTNEDEDVTEFTFSPVIIKSEDEEKPELHLQSLTEDTKDCGGPEPARDSSLHGHLGPVSPEASETFAAGYDSNTEDSEDSQGTSRRRAGLKKRKPNLSSTEKPFLCTECGKRFKLKEHLKAHVRIHTGEKPFGCSICGKSFNQKSNLRRHAVTHTGEKPFVCNVCGNGFRLKDSLKSHLKIHTGEKPFVCSVCGKRFKEKDYLTEHMSVHTGEKRFRCQVCHHSFTWRHQLRNHQCVGYSSQLHQRPTENTKDYGGPEPVRDAGPCGPLEPVSPEVAGKDVLASEDDRRTNRRRAGMKNLKPNVFAAEKPFLCIECGKGFKVNAHLKAHVRIHTGEKPFGCSVCGKSFNQKSNLRRHAVTHTGEKPFVCNVCGNGFRLKDSLKSHLKIHTGEKPFVCSVCGNRFRLKDSLKSHLKIHTGEKPFVCSICGKRFKEKDYLMKHMSIHTGKKHFSCQVCRRSFARRQQLRNHQCVGYSSQLHQRPTEKKEEEPQTSRSMDEHMLMETSEGTQMKE